MGRETTWTVVLRCYRCQENFLISHVILERVKLLAGVCPCTLCGAKPSVSESRLHRLLDFTDTMETVYRTCAGERIWHFVAECSSWPSHEFIELNTRPTIRGHLCEECVDRLHNFSSGSISIIMAPTAVEAMRAFDR
jgi:hypothetical protein